MKKIKSFIKEHKTEIGMTIATGVVTISCIVLHKKVSTNIARPILKFEGRAKEFTEAIESVDKIAKNKDFGWGYNLKISDLGMYGEGR